MGSSITWYSIDNSLAKVERGEVDLKQALATLEGYLERNDGQKHEWGEDALAASSLGFSRSGKDFLEICIHTHAEISVTREVQIPRKMLGVSLPKTERTESTVAAGPELTSLVERFFRE